MRIYQSQIVMACSLLLGCSDGQRAEVHEPAADFEHAASKPTIEAVPDDTVRRQHLQKLAIRELSTGLILEADRLIEAGDLSSANERYAKVLGTSDVPEDLRSKALALFDETRKAESIEDATDFLRTLPEKSFDAFQHNQLPSTTYCFTDLRLREIFISNCRKVKDEARQMREDDANLREAEMRANARKEKAGIELARVDGIVHEAELCVSDSGKFIACQLSESEIRICDAASGRQISILRLHESSEQHMRKAIAFSPDAKLVAAIVEGGNRIAVWSIQGGLPLRYFELSSTTSKSENYVCLALTSKYLIAGGSNFSESESSPIQTWDLTTGKVLGAFNKHRDTVTCVVITPDGRYCVSGGDDRLAILWEISTFAEIRLYDAHEDSVLCAAVSPNGKLLLTGGAEGKCRLWALPIGTEIASWTLSKFDGLAEAKRKLEIAGRQIGGEPVRFVPRKNGSVTSVDFSPQGDRALIALSYFDTTELLVNSNPTLIDVQRREIVDLPPPFTTLSQFGFGNQRAAFCNGGDAALLISHHMERHRGQESLKTSASVVGLP